MPFFVGCASPACACLHADRLHLTFDQLIELLKKNRNKVSIDPSERKTQEFLERHYTKSMPILEPLDARIKATDELIDETVIAKYHIDKAMLHCIKSSNNKP